MLLVKKEPTASVLPLHIIAVLSNDGCNYRPKHVVMNVKNKLIYKHLCRINGRIAKLTLIEQMQSDDVTPENKYIHCFFKLISLLFAACIPTHQYIRDLQHNENIITYGPLISIAPITLFVLPSIHGYIYTNRTHTYAYIYIYIYIYTHTQIYMPNNMGEKELRVSSLLCYVCVFCCSSA